MLEALYTSWCTCVTKFNLPLIRYVGGDRENGDSQEQRDRTGAQKGDAHLCQETKVEDLHADQEEQNSIWSKPSQLGKRWTWRVLGIGFAGALLERVLQGQLILDG